MALPTIESATNQMLNESVREQPSVAMKGNVDSFFNHIHKIIKN